jgi:hypothetical protein
MKGYGSAAVIATALCVLLATGASAQVGSRQTAELKFLEQEASAPTGFTLNIDYVNPSDPDAKPPAVRKVVEELAEGAQIDTAVPDRCTASDAQLMLLGADACPAGSRVGAGTITIDTGFPDPGRFILADVVFVNNTNELIFVSTERDSGARVVTRSAVEGRRIVTEAPPLPGTPPDGGAIDEVRVQIDEVSRTIDGVRHGYVTTPGSCPQSRAWINSVAFTYADGVSQTVDTPSRCVKPRKRPAR